MTANLMKRLDFYASMVRTNAFTRGALGVAFFLLYRHLNSRSGRCDPSMATLARETGLSGRSVKSAIAELRNSGLWRVAREGAAARGGRTNSYAPRFEALEHASGDAHDTSFAPKVVKHTTPVRAESGAKQRPKVVKHASPRTSKEPGINARAPPREVEDGANSAFEAFWRIYPHRDGHPDPKKPAQLKFEAAVKRGVDPAEIIAGAERYRASIEANGTEGRFVAQAVTWLNQERWNDYREASDYRPRLRVGMN
jgi:hypothetical protein